MGQPGGPGCGFRGWWPEQFGMRGADAAVRTSGYEGSARFSQQPRVGLPTRRVGPRNALRIREGESGFYNTRRAHQSLGGRTPDEVYFQISGLREAAYVPMTMPYLPRTALQSTQTTSKCGEWLRLGRPAVGSTGGDLPERSITLIPYQPVQESPTGSGHFGA